MALVERDQEVQALAASCSAEPLTYAICHWCPHGSSKNPRTKVRHRLVQFSREDAVAVVDQEAIRMAARQGLSELLQGPFRSWVGGNVVMNKLPGAQLQDHEYTENPEGGRDHNEEVTRHLGMVVDEGQPTLLGIRRARRRATTQVLLHGAGRNSNSQLQFQLIDDPLFSPGRILGGHLSDQYPQWLGEARSARRFGLPAPK